MNDIAISDLRNQSLAELNLHAVDDQFPLTIEIGKKPLSYWAVKSLVDLELNSTWSNGTIPSHMQTLSLTNGFHTSVLQVKENIGQGIYGVVYNVVISGKDASETPVEVEAVLKKSNIYSGDGWVLLNVLEELVKLDQFQVPENDEKRLWLESIEKQHVPISNYDRSEYIENLKQFLRASEVNHQNGAYIDSVGSYLGSLMVGAKVSPCFPLVYASFRAHDKAFFTDTMQLQYLPHINEGFPVQVTIMQKLKATLYSTVVEKLPHSYQANAITFPTYDHYASLIVQLMFGIMQMQTTFDMVHNDLHLNNIMYEEVPNDSHVYYKFRNRFYKVPTFGKVWKIIDFGYAAFELRTDKGTVQFRSEVMNRNPAFNYQYDLSEVVKNIKWVLNLNKKLSLGPGGREVKAILRAMMSEMCIAKVYSQSCARNGAFPADWIDVWCPVYAVAKSKVPTDAIVYKQYERPLKVLQ